MTRVVVLTTERLTIRQIDAGDASFILELLNDPSFIHNIGDRNVRTLDDAREYIHRGPHASYEQHGFGLWLVELKGEGTPIGICGLLKRDVLDAPDVGFAYLPPFQSTGYGFEAARAVLDHARDTLRLPRVVAIVNADNEPSARHAVPMLHRGVRRARKSATVDHAYVDGRANLQHRGTKLGAAHLWSL